MGGMADGRLWTEAPAAGAYVRATGGALGPRCVYEEVVEGYLGMKDARDDEEGVRSSPGTESTS
jgi:hypothetical protein